VHLPPWDKDDPIREALTTPRPLRRGEVKADQHDPDVSSEEVWRQHRAVGFAKPVGSRNSVRFAYERSATHLGQSAAVIRSVLYLWGKETQSRTVRGVVASIWCRPFRDQMPASGVDNGQSIIWLSGSKTVFCSD
jgi:hypothetical protein